MSSRELEVVGEREREAPPRRPAEQLVLVALVQRDHGVAVRTLEGLAEPRRDQGRERHEAAELERAAEPRVSSARSARAPPASRSTARARVSNRRPAGVGETPRAWWRTSSSTPSDGLELRERRRHRRGRDGDLAARPRVTLPASQVATKYSSCRSVKRMLGGSSAVSRRRARRSSARRSDPARGSRSPAACGAHTPPERSQLGDRVVVPVDPQVGDRPAHRGRPRRARPSAPARPRRRPRGPPRARARAARRARRAAVLERRAPSRRARRVSASRLPAATQPGAARARRAAERVRARVDRRAPLAVDRRQLAVARCGACRRRPSATASLGRAPPASSVEQARAERGVGDVLRRDRARAGARVRRSARRRRARRTRRRRRTAPRRAHAARQREGHAVSRAMHDGHLDEPLGPGQRDHDEPGEARVDAAQALAEHAVDRLAVPDVGEVDVAARRCARASRRPRPSSSSMLSITRSACAAGSPTPTSSRAVQVLRAPGRAGRPCRRRPRPGTDR